MITLIILMLLLLVGVTFLAFYGEVDTIKIFAYIITMVIFSLFMNAYKDLTVNNITIYKSLYENKTLGKFEQEIIDSKGYQQYVLDRKFSKEK